jgi:asparagine synthase (glutamine-hydrolysing)
VGYLNELARTGHWLKLAVEAHGLGRRYRVSSAELFWRHVRSHTLTPLKDRLKAVPAARSVGGALLRGAARSGKASGAPKSLLNQEFARRIQLAERVRALQADRLQPARTEREEHYRQLSWGVMPFILELAGRSAAAFGVEPVYPFWDRQLVEFCLSLPPEQKIRRGWTRYVMRRAMEGILPEMIQWRGGKANFSDNFQLTRFDADQALLEEVIVRDPGGLAEYVDVNALRGLYQRYLARRLNSDALAIWKAVTLALWLKRACPVS